MRRRQSWMKRALRCKTSSTSNWERLINTRTASSRSDCDRLSLFSLGVGRRKQVYPRSSSATQKQTQTSLAISSSNERSNARDFTYLSHWLPLHTNRWRNESRSLQSHTPLSTTTPLLNLSQNFLLQDGLACLLAAIIFLLSSLLSQFLQKAQDVS